jgi:hypothetical protein
MTYPEVYSRLCFETAIVIFMKKDGSIRLMLCTRNMTTINLKYGNQVATLAGHERRCSINNGNIAVFDLDEGDARQFNIDRLTSYTTLGVIGTKEELDKAFKTFGEYKEWYAPKLKVEEDEQ